MKPRVHLSISLLLYVLTVSADVWLNPTRGFAWTEKTSPDGRIANDSASPLLRSVRMDKPSSYFSIATIVTNLNDSPDTGYTFTDSLGKRHRTYLPRYALILTSDDDKTIRLNASIAASGPEEFLSLTDRLMLTIGADTLQFTPGRHSSLAGYSLTAKDGILRISYGHRKIEEVFTCNLPEDFRLTNIGVELEPGAAINVKYLHIECKEETLVPEPIAANHAAELVRKSSDPLAGYWKVTSRSLEEKELRSGGDYTLVLLPHSIDKYVLYYMNGAEVCPSAWRPGRAKGVLSRVLHPRYDAEWYDAEGNPMDEVVAIFDDDNTLTIHFPSYDGSTLTLQRLPQPPTVSTTLDTTDP